MRSNVPANRHSPWLSVAFIITVLVGSLLRFWKLPELPPGFNQDEASAAYEAYALLHTGADRWGNPWPVCFPSWGSGQNVLLSYLAIPAIKIFGLTPFSVRIVMAAVGTATVPLLYGCLKPLGKTTALVAALALAVSPWHFMLSRWALESNLAPATALLGCYALLKALRTGRAVWIVPSLLPFAFSLYAYGTTLVVLPLFFALVAPLAWKRMKRRPGPWCAAMLLAGIVATPFGIFVLENYVLGRNLAWSDDLPFGTPMLPELRTAQAEAASWQRMAGDNLALFGKGFNDGPLYNRLPGFSPIFPGALALGLAGMAWSAVSGWRRKEPDVGADVTGIFTAWGGAALPLLLLFEINTNRFNLFFIPCLVMAVWLAARCFERIKQSGVRLAMASAGVAFILLHGALAAREYFGGYAGNSVLRAQMHDGLEEAFSALDGVPAEQVLISSEMQLPYVYTLFFTRYSPHRFQREAVIAVEEGEYRVARFGRYIFRRELLTPGEPYGYLCRVGAHPSGVQKIVFRKGGWEVGLAR